MRRARFQDNVEEVEDIPSRGVQFSEDNMSKKKVGITLPKKCPMGSKLSTISTIQEDQQVDTLHVPNSGHVRKPRAKKGVRIAVDSMDDPASSEEEVTINPRMSSQLDLLISPTLALGSKNLAKRTSSRPAESCPMGHSGSSKSASGPPGSPEKAWQPKKKSALKKEKMGCMKKSNSSGGTPARKKKATGGLKFASEPGSPSRNKDPDKKTVKVNGRASVMTRVVPDDEHAVPDTGAKLLSMASSYREGTFWYKCTEDEDVDHDLEIPFREIEAKIKQKIREQGMMCLTFLNPNMRVVDMFITCYPPSKFSIAALEGDPESGTGAKKVSRNPSTDEFMASKHDYAAGEVENGAMLVSVQRAIKRNGQWKAVGAVNRGDVYMTKEMMFEDIDSLIQHLLDNPHVAFTSIKTGVCLKFKNVNQHSKKGFREIYCNKYPLESFVLVAANPVDKEGNIVYGQGAIKAEPTFYNPTTGILLPKSPSLFFDNPLLNTFVDLFERFMRTQLEQDFSSLEMLTGENKDKLFNMFAEMVSQPYPDGLGDMDESMLQRVWHDVLDLPYNEKHWFYAVLVKLGSVFPKGGQFKRPLIISILLMQLEGILEVNHSITLASAFWYNWEFVPGWEKVNGRWRFNKSKAQQEPARNKPITFDDFDTDFLDPLVRVDDINARPLRNIRLICRFTPRKTPQGDAEDNFFRCFMLSTVLGIKIVPALFSVANLAETYMEDPDEEILEKIVVHLDIARVAFMGLIKGFRMLLCTSPMELHKMGLPPGLYSKTCDDSLINHIRRSPYMKQKENGEWIQQAAIMPEMLKVYQTYVSWDEYHPVVHGQPAALGSSGFQVDLFHVIDHFLGNEFDASVTRDKEDNVQYGMDPRARNTVRAMLLKRNVLRQFRKSLTQGLSYAFKSCVKVLQSMNSFAHEVLLFRGTHVNRVRQYAFLSVQPPSVNMGDGANRMSGVSTGGNGVNEFEKLMSHIHERTAKELHRFDRPIKKCPFANLKDNDQPKSMLPVKDELIFDQNLREVKWHEVRPHSSKDSVWIVIDGIVLDVTYWLPQHPGGLSPMGWAGLDATYHFWKVPNHRWFASQPDRWIIQREIEPMIYTKPGTDEITKVEMTNWMVDTIMKSHVIVRMKDLPVFAVAKIDASERFVALTSIEGVKPYED